MWSFPPPPSLFDVNSQEIELNRVWLGLEFEMFVGCQSNLDDEILCAL